MELLTPNGIERMLRGEQNITLFVLRSLSIQIGPHAIESIDVSDVNGKISTLTIDIEENPLLKKILQRRDVVLFDAIKKEFDYWWTTKFEKIGVMADADLISIKESFKIKAKLDFKVNEFFMRPREIQDTGSRKLIDDLFNKVILQELPLSPDLKEKYKVTAQKRPANTAICPQRPIPLQSTPNANFSLASSPVTPIHLLSLKQSNVCVQGIIDAIDKIHRPELSQILMFNANLRSDSNNDTIKVIFHGDYGTLKSISAQLNLGTVVKLIGLNVNKANEDLRTSSHALELHFNFKVSSLKIIASPPAVITKKEFYAPRKVFNNLKAGMGPIHLEAKFIGAIDHFGSAKLQILNFEDGNGKVLQILDFSKLKIEKGIHFRIYNLVIFQNDRGLQAKACSFTSYEKIE